MKTLLLTAALFAVTAQADQPVYRCERDGKVAYSDAPCVGAKKIDTTPTQGMDKHSGQSRKGKDVQRDERNNTMSDALRPLVGLSRDQYKTAARRNPLPQEHKRRCAVLDDAVPQQEKALEATSLSSKADSEMQLYNLRKEYRDLKC